MNRETIIAKEINYFKNSPLAKEPAFIPGNYDEEYNDYSEGRCVYLTDEGRKCAVGALLKPALYKDSFDSGDGIGVLGLPENVKEFLGKDNLDWLQKLQNCHDDCARNWREEKEYGEEDHFGRWFLKVATKNKLLAA